MADGEQDRSASDSYDLDEIARLIALVEQRGLTELVVEDDAAQIRIRGAAFGRARGGRPPARPAAEPDVAEDVWLPEMADAPIGGEALAPPETRTALHAPVVGVFYRSSGPDAAPYVEVGDRVEVGQIIGLIEAMKVFSEIPAETAGTVVEIVAQSGQLVRPGEPLMYLSQGAG